MRKKKREKSGEIFKKKLAVKGSAFDFYIFDFAAISLRNFRSI